MKGRAMPRMTEAEKDATYLAAFAASCALNHDWKMLEEELLARLQKAEERGRKRARRNTSK